MLAFILGYTLLFFVALLRSFFIISVMNEYSGFFITDPVGNNRLNYVQRQHPKIYVPSLVHGGLSDLKEAKTIALECDVDGHITAGYGLEHFLFLEHARVPTWIFDNHNHAYAFWHHARELGHFSTPLPVIHIDQHTDLGLPVRFRSPDERVFEYTNQVLTIADFILPALQEKLITAAYIVTDESVDSARCFVWESDTLVRKQHPLPERDFILDIDLDYFAQGFDEEITLALVQSLIARATIITVATSPLFITFQKAQDILKSLQKDLLSL